MNTIFTTKPSPADAIGACSLVIYSLLVMVIVKYILLLMSADHHSEGGVFALCSLVVQKGSAAPRWLKKWVAVLGMVGAGLLLGDGAITPAISVLSAIEGLALPVPSLSEYTVLISSIILVILFLVQPFGTAKVGFVFGPIMVLWFIALFSIGIYNITFAPRAFVAFNPWEGISFFIRNGPESYFTLASVFLCVTGNEAMFADMGHFGKGPVRLAWMVIVLPGVLLNYIGQTSLLMVHPELYGTPFYSSIPTPLYWPMFVLATLAGIIASQAVISGSYSIISEAIWLGLSPPFRIKQTSKSLKGQIYIPIINFVLMIATLGIIIGFKTSSAMTNAYGITVCTQGVLSSILFFLVMRYNWGLQWWKCAAFLTFLFFDLCFFGAVISKLPKGGYAAIIISAIFFLTFIIWYIGEKNLRKYRKSHNVSTRLELLGERFIIPEAKKTDFGDLQSEEEREVRGTTRYSFELQRDHRNSLSPTRDKPRAHSLSLERKRPELRALEVVGNAFTSSSSEKKKETISKVQWKDQNENPDSSKSSKQENKNNSDPSKSSKQDLKADKQPEDSSKSSPNKDIEDLPNNSKDIPPAKVLEKTFSTVNLLPDPFIYQVEMFDGAGNIIEHSITTLPFVGVFLTDSSVKTPESFELFLDRICGLPKTVIFLKLTKPNIPFVTEEDRVQVKQLFDSVYFVTLSFGYAEVTQPNTIIDILTSKPQGLPQYQPNEIAIFIPADKVKVVNTNYFWKAIFWVYAKMKSLFFGVQKVKFPAKHSVYLVLPSHL
uniref:Potassium transporter n=1 Tax=Arcella intermedia TaxID=1963864 RepID=A0A6B2KYH3_9EUKA